MARDAEGRNVVVVLMKSPEADATIAVVRDRYADAAVEDHGTYWQISRPDELVVDMARVGEELGEPITLSEWLVVMSTFVGRVETDPGYFRVTSRMVELEGAG